MATLKVTNIKNESFAGDQLYLKTDGKIGIGTGSPSDALEISHASDPAIRLHYGSNSGYSLLNIDSSNNLTLDVDASAAGSNSFCNLKIDGSEKLRITSDGNVGIGTTSPLYPLHLKNAMSSSPYWIHMEVSGSNTTGGGAGIAFDTSATNQASNNGLFLATVSGERSASADGSNSLVFKTSKSNVAGDGSLTSGPKTQMVITEDGNVGIGTTSPTNKLEISGGLVRCLGTASARFTVNNGAAEGFFGWNSGTLYLGGASALLNIAASGSNNIQLETNSSTRMTIKSDGDIEVGGNLKTNNLSGKNLIINGAFTISQRGTSFSFAHDGTTTSYTIDRFFCNTTSLDEFDGTVSQDSTVPAGEGFSKSLKFLTGTAESQVGSGERVEVWQKLEGQDLQHLAYGSSAAKKVTVSFWVRSSITGTFGFSIYRNESAGDRIVNKPYTISSANTWEKKTCTIDGDTVRAITNDTGSRARLVWFLLSGSDFTSGSTQSSWNGYTSNTFAAGHAQNGVPTTAGATWYITGIQFEIGSIATEFEHRSHGEELLSCYRYYHQITNPRMNGYIPDNASKGYVFDMQHPVPMRSGPTVTITNTGTVGGQYVFDGSSNALVTSLMGAYSMSGSDIRYTEMDLNLSGDLTDTRGAWTGSTNNTGRRSVYTFSSEL